MKAIRYGDEPRRGTVQDRWEYIPSRNEIPRAKSTPEPWSARWAESSRRYRERQRAGASPDAPPQG